jgi:Mg-chelatase subunit ChlD
MPRRQRIASLAVRCAIITLIVLALAGLSLLRPTKRQHVVFAVDRSLSIGDVAQQRIDQLLRRAEQARGGDRMTTLDFGTDGGRTTNIAQAITLAAASMDPNRVPHLVLITDGNETQGDARHTATGAAMRISTIALPARDEPEVQVSRVGAPAQVRVGEPFDLVVTIDANRSGAGMVEVFRGAHRVARQTVQLVAGENELRLRQTADSGRMVEFTVRVSGFEDTLLDNNAAGAMVFAQGRPRVLLIDSQPRTARHLARALAQQQIDMDIRPPQGMPVSLAELQGYELLIVSNVAATDLSLEQMETARSYVRDLGGGLIMIGGDQSFGLGGYYKTPIEQILPVRSDIEKQSQKPSLAMMLVIDKSGSMGGLKIELAKDAARSAVELLGPRDQIGVIAFDSDPFVVSELHSAADARFVMGRIASITAGGGTSMAAPLQQAYDDLLATSAQLKHVIVLTDGQSAPGDFDAIAANMAAARITLTTVAVGGDADRIMLERIAQIGGGRHYFTDDPSTIPQIFARETIAAGNSAMNEQPFRPQVMRYSPAISGIDFGRAPYLLGYVTTRPKATSEVILTTEAGDPLLAWWRYGLGMTAAFTSDAKAVWAAEWISWEGFGPFWAQVVRHVMRKSASQGMIAHVEPGKVTVDVVDGDSQYRNDARIGMTIVGPNLSAQRVTMQRVAPGR